MQNLHRPGYPRGARGEKRRYAHLRQLALLERALAPWPRRQAPLLEVNCASGAFLPFLWQCGFEARATEEDPVLRQRARAVKVPDISVIGASDDDLPFDNDSFDWAIVHLKTGNGDAISASAQECARVARRGIMLAFWNSLSLPALTWRLGSNKAWMPSSASARVVWQRLLALNLGRISMHSTLAAPLCLWHKGAPGAGACLTGLPIGAWCLARVDLGAERTGTPLPLRLGSALPGNAEPVMEYAQKSSQAEEVIKP